ncbi:uncharacterized protein LOC107819632 [Nicotiana tabacum]|uniref:Uncharacterized protein LOC107819632 n=1 Tax=Nicotiana tabacum TaxID=4097 RepID=A0AC58RP22_TOBAC
MVTILTNAGIESEQKEALKIPIILLVFTAENLATLLTIAGSRTTADGSGDLNLLEHHKKNRKEKWYLDSACSRHMIGQKQLFKMVTKLDRRTVTFGDKSKENVIGIGRVPLSSTCDVDEVYLVDKLGYNLLSTSQLCDNDYEVRLKKHGWFIEDESGKVVLSRNRDRNVYTITNLDSFGNQICLASIIDDPWENKSGPLLKSKILFPLQSLPNYCIWIFGPTRTASIGGRKYAFIIVDDFSRFTWVVFLSHKDKGLRNFEVFCKKVRREKGYYIFSIRSDHGGEFESIAFENFCNDQGISHNFSSPRSPQQNGVMERKNRTLQDMVDEALGDKSWITAMKEELDQFEKQKETSRFVNESSLNHVYKLFKALYGLKQAPRARYERISSFIVQHRFDRGFLKHQGEFKMMGKLTFFLGLQIKKVQEEIFISQTKYPKELIKKFGMSNAKAIGTPMSPSTALDEDKNSKSVDEIMYRGMIASLLYLTTSRPDIMFTVCKCARYPLAPKEYHLTAIKRIIRYLTGIVGYGLWYSGHQGSSSAYFIAMSESSYCPPAIQGSSSGYSGQKT